MAAPFESNEIAEYQREVRGLKKLRDSSFNWFLIASYPSHELGSWLQIRKTKEQIHDPSRAEWRQSQGSGTFSSSVMWVGAVASSDGYTGLWLRPTDSGGRGRRWWDGDKRFTFEYSPVQRSDPCVCHLHPRGGVWKLWLSTDLSANPHSITH